MTRLLNDEVSADDETTSVAALHGWSTLRLDEAIDVAKGQVDPRVEPFSSMFHVGPENLEPNTGRLLSSKRAGDLGLISGKYIFHNGEIVYSKIRPYLRKVWLATFEGLCSADMYPLRARSGFDTRFLTFYLLSDPVTRQVVATQDRTGIPKVNREQLGRVLISVPSSEAEQRAIASVLTDVQSAISNEERRNSILRQLKSATAAKLFREGLRRESLKQTTIGPICSTWQVVPLGNTVTSTQYGLSIRGERQGRIPILRMNCQEDGRIVFRDLQYVMLDESTAKPFLLRDGDILFNRTNSIDLVGRTALFTGTREAVFASYLIRLQVAPNTVVPSFLNHYLNLASVQQSLKTLATRGVSQSNISASKLRGFPVPVPPIEEQHQITAILDEIDLRVANSASRTTHLRALFDSTLDQLMTGKLRVAPLLEQQANAHA